jgi:hypothetical protein
VILESLDVPLDELERRTGWTLKPEGACKGDVCVPLPGSGHAGTTIDARVLSEGLGMPLVHDEAAGLWALGPETVAGKALTTATAPELTLPDLDGNPFSLTSLRGRRVLLVAWASW